MLLSDGVPCPIAADPSDDAGILLAINNLRGDFERVCGDSARLLHRMEGNKLIIVGSLQSKFIKKLIENDKIDADELNGTTEKYLLTCVSRPFDGVDEAFVVTGSDKRGVIYGIYELSEQIGVTPWYDWADAPVKRQTNLCIQKGSYSAGEPSVKYRGIFLNDEAPCLTTWVKNTYGTDYGDHRFYARVCELILRLRGNLLWPAMWSWSFYADDSLNSRTADMMGIIIGTSHHEPMARNHQEWARNRQKYGAWDYASNQSVLDNFFEEGIRRASGRENLITIGMRGDGDAPMNVTDEDGYNMRLLNKVIENQRRIIEKVTQQPARETPQVWAIYKEVQKYYDNGFRAPDDVIYLLCDDNWGNVRFLPDPDGPEHAGGYGMYYHADYVGAPRNSKWLNCTPVQNIWEQMQLAYDYGVDKLWILNVGDLKPMEYPITFFLDMAWNPKKFTASNLSEHTRNFCARIFGDEQADEAARILNLYTKFNARCTPEMLDCNTYNLDNGEWQQVAADYRSLETDALRQYVSLPQECRNAYKQLILFPVQAMSNLYEMYYAQAMNHKLFAENNPQAGVWAEKTARAFARDSALCADYNLNMSGGKWNGMMTQKHIGYSSWNDDFPSDAMPEVFRTDDDTEQKGGYVFQECGGVVSIEAEHFYESVDAGKAVWTVIPYLGRTLSGIALMPYDMATDSAALVYKMRLFTDAAQVKVHVIVKSTLAFLNRTGHRYAVGFKGGNEITVNFNADQNEDEENVYSVFYPTVARRVVEKEVTLSLPKSADGMQTLVVKPLDPGVVFEKIVVDCGGYSDSYLFSDESPLRKE